MKTLELNSFQQNTYMVKFAICVFKKDIFCEKAEYVQCSHLDDFDDKYERHGEGEQDHEQRHGGHQQRADTRPLLAF